MVGLVVLAVYALTLPFGFVGDDRLLFEKNPFLGPGHTLREFWTQDLWSASGARLASAAYRPLPMSLAWLDARLFGVSPLTLRAVNLLAHATTAEVLSRLLVRRLGAERRALGVSLTLLFALHPLSTEHVVSLSGRFDGLALLFIALGLFENGSHRADWTLPLCTLAALLSKETGVVLPFAIAASDWAERRAFAPRKWARVTAALVAVAALRQAAGVAWTNDAPRVELASGIPGFAELVVTYAQLSVLPVGLDLYHPSQPPTFGVGLAILAASVAAFLAGLRNARARRRPDIASGAVLVLLPLVLSSYVGPVERAFGDRFAAIPTFGAILILGSTELPRFVTSRVGLRVSFAVVGLLGFVTLDRALYFRSDETLGRAALARDPDHFYWLTIDGLRAYDRGDLVRAKASLEKAEAAMPGFGKASAGLCAVEVARGRADVAERACHRAIAASPRDSSTWASLASALTRQERWREALAAAERSLRLRPATVDALYLRALALDRLGRSDEALASARRVLELSPNHAGAWLLALEIPRRRKPPGPPQGP